MDINGLPLTLSVVEAAELLGIGRDAAYRAVADGEIPSLRLGRTIRIPTAKLLDTLGVSDETAYLLGTEANAEHLRRSLRDLDLEEDPAPAPRRHRRVKKDDKEGRLYIVARLYNDQVSAGSRTPTRDVFDVLNEGKPEHETLSRSRVAHLVTEARKRGWIASEEDS